MESKWIQMNIREYFKFLNTLGISSCVIPDINPKIMLYYLDEVQKYFKGLLEDRTVYVHRHYPFLAIQEFFGTEYYDFLLASTTVHTFLPFTLDEICSLAPDIALVCDNTPYKSFLSSAFTSKDDSKYIQSLIDHPNVSFIDSPIVQLYADNKRHTWDTYLNSLPAKRRYKVKKAREEFKDVQVEMIESLTIEHKNWLVTQTKKYWTELHQDKDEYMIYENALMQIVWSWSVSDMYSGCVKWFIAKNIKGEILSIVSFIERDEYFFFNSFSRSADLINSCANIGVFILSKVVEYFINNSTELSYVKYLEPTVGTSYCDSGYGTYKRTICNAEGRKPTIAISATGQAIDNELYGKVYDAGWKNIEPIETVN